MKRRAFLNLMALFALNPDPEKLLWIPGKKTIFIPSSINYADIIAIQDELVMRKVKQIFNNDITFYNIMRK